MERKDLILIFIVICLIIALSYLLFTYTGKSQMQENPIANPDNNPKPDSPSNGDLGGTNPPGETLVVPEVPLGVLGSISALAIALGIFALTKKRRI
ncbi:MAG: hypothetical protein ACPLKQ_04640 [Candidatus Bathyarchaeales archaeon]